MLQDVFHSASFDDHEQVIFCRDAAAGLTAIIAIHSTKLGPAAGGCRRYAYASVQAALDDVLRLSRAMTYKNALAGLPLGGGKSVILLDPAVGRSDQALRAFGAHVERLGGSYWTAEDVGVGLADVAQIGAATQHVFGTTGDPSPFTARGVFQGLRAAVQYRLQRSELSGLHVAVQGVGAVGRNLCRLLAERGVRLTVTDLHAQAAAEMAAEFGAEIVGGDEIYGVDADVFAPCALGATVNEGTASRLRATIVAGAANNALATPKDGVTLRERNILFAPDFVINAGGMMHAGREILGSYDERQVNSSIDGIYGTSMELFARATLRGTTPEVEATRLAIERLAA